MNNFEEDDSRWSRVLVNNSIFNLTFQSDDELRPGYSLLIVFETVRIASSIFSVLGVIGNIALIYVICNTSFRHVSYGLLIITIAFFDSIRLLSSIYYYLLFANVIPINKLSEIIYIALDRYPIFVVNWCKVLMAIERLLTVRYWEHHTHTDWRSKHKRKQHRLFTYSILFVLLSGVISQHPNILYHRYESIDINYNRLMMIIKQNPNYSYGSYLFNAPLFTIVSYITLDTTLPIIFVLIINVCLLREIRKLPLSLQIKVKESIGILFFLTFLSIAYIPRVFITFYHYYLFLNNFILLKRIIIIFYMCLGIEYFNHAVTGYTCFLSSTVLRSELKNMIWTKYIAPHLH